MIVYKFGGASVRQASGLRNLLQIVRSANERLCVVVSAMGKTTNALERLADFAYRGEMELAEQQLNDIRDYHFRIVEDLYPQGHAFIQQKIVGYCNDLLSLMRLTNKPSYDEYYDQIVSYGELISTRIVSVMLHREGISNEYVDMTQTLITDDLWREATVDFRRSTERLRSIIDGSTESVFIMQGFVGGTIDGKHTTLGREGSDYTAALVANMLDAQSVTIWKDVAGILNADPRRQTDTVKIDEMSYSEAVELAYSGAQVIHPKTIRPLANKNISLYVKPFADSKAAGTHIFANAKRVDLPVYIWRDKQVLITVRPLDYAFVLEDCLQQFFSVIHKHRLKVSLIQSSAVTVSVSVDDCSRLEAAIEELQHNYKVSFNKGLSLLTIRSTNDEINQKAVKDRAILLSQKTRRTARFLVRSND